MNLPMIEMSEDEAAELLDEYRELPEARRTPEDTAAIAGYEALADGYAVIDLFRAMNEAGLNADGMPRLAIARADRRSVRFARNRWTGAGTFDAGAANYSRENGSLQVALPERCWTFEPSRDYGPERIAYTPTIPPRHRPPAYLLRERYVLWEAVWEPSPPVDPFLLKPLGGLLYAVVAQWDLTPLEQAVLRGRILNERR